MIIKKNESKTIKCTIGKYEDIKEEKEFKAYIYKGKRIMRILQGSLKESSNKTFIINTKVFPNNKRNANHASPLSSTQCKLQKCALQPITPKDQFETLFQDKFKATIKHRKTFSTIPTTGDNIKIKEQRTHKTLKSCNSEVSVYRKPKMVDAYHSITQKKACFKRKIHFISPLSTQCLLSKRKSYISTQTQSIIQRSTYNSSSGTGNDNTKAQLK